MKTKQKNNFWQKLKSFLKLTLKTSEDVLFPKNIKCLSCGRDLKQKQNIEFCDECLSQICFISEDCCCTRCGTKLKFSNVCDNCHENARSFDIARSVVVYDEIVAKLIKRFKFSNAPYISRTFGYLLSEKFKELNWKVDYLIPVPVTAKTLKTRGFNQAELLADEFCKFVEIQKRTDILSKTKQTEDQATLNFLQRQQNLKTSFKVLKPADVKGKSILIIDDVFTTGATASACAETLKQKGAKQVFVLCVASTMLKKEEKKN